MSVTEHPRPSKPAHGFTWGRAIRLGLFVVLCVAGYAAFQLVPGWFRFLAGRETAVLRRNVAILFVDTLLIAYPLTLLSALVGALVLVFLLIRARSRRRRRDPNLPTTLLHARLLLLCCSTLFGLAVFEAGAAAWRSRLYRSPDLPAVAERQESEERSDAREDPGLPGRFEGARTAAAAGAGQPLRILVIGESSAQGEPYQPWLSVAQIVAWRLEKVFPGRAIQVDMWAYGGAILRTMHQKLAGLNYRPDALMVYVGHNEFQGRYAWMREVDHYSDDDPVPRDVAGSSGLFSVLRYSRVCLLLGETRERQRLDALPPRIVTRKLVDRPLCTVAEFEAVTDDFERRLESIARYCELIGTLPIYVIPPCNDAGWDPSRSVLAAETPRAERDEFAKEVAHARALEPKARTEAQSIYRDLVKRHPEFAETHFRLAGLLEQSGEWDEARDHFVKARESDGMPLRCPEPLREVYRKVAARHSSIVLVDGPRVLEARSRHGIIDGYFFHDAQHPNLRGYAALAEDLMKQLSERRAFSWPEGKPAPVIDAEMCAGQFGIDATRWAEIASRDFWFFRIAAYIRFDPQFRNERAREYLQAAAALRAGHAPAVAGLPGWPMAPPLSTSHRIKEPKSREP